MMPAEYFLWCGQFGLLQDITALSLCHKRALMVSRYSFARS
jgi:hypothetical protein